MLLEIVPGGELWSRLRNVGRMSPQETVFYAAMVSSAFGYLHTRRIAHRDLKPENLLFDRKVT
jgi:serine/threonine protein kinase